MNGDPSVGEFVSATRVKYDEVGSIRNGKAAQTHSLILNIMAMEAGLQNIELTKYLLDKSAP